MNSIENTRELILEVASGLFMTKGYEKTRISDIINGLDGLTKGAVYHYFDSKEDIFNEVVKRIGYQNKAIFDEIKYAKDLNGREKISKLISVAIGNTNMDVITSISPNLTDNPKLLASFFKQMQEMTIPEYFLPIIYEGIKDGSIKSEYPQELAELIAVMLNIWLNPLIFNKSNDTVRNKINIINRCLSDFNISFSI
ncbi:MAG: TetR/AcrR family transcriptional regulator [Gemella haemolysans]|uniref:Transcriptional regulator, TetR family n=1 Tax=Gemella haemolysans TaxID=1379 RepID=A0A133ZXL9_9BACL|nr:TetR/AcrR family transcriptional regulator [Gemella haemolysans]KXB60183.1 transcriptional regulator, TetR family [Gemella haemolysans]MBS5319321.1 TetR/AcrR family transcriptional regulator [Gemella haemolysans]